MGTALVIDQYAAYDLWANTLFVRRLDREPDELLDREVKSSFPSLRLTILHMRNAEAAWLARVSGAAQQWPAEPDTSIGNLLKHSARMRDHVAGLKEKDLAAEVNYQDLKGNTHRSPIWQMLMHCFNHSTYHRGQLVTIMRTLGLEDIPSSDLVVYQRSLKKTP